MYIVTTASPELRLYKRGGVVLRNAAVGASIGDSLAEPRALAYASRTAYVSHA